MSKKLMIMGIACIACAAVLVFYTQISQNKAQENAVALVGELYQSMPPVTEGFLEEQGENAMPMSEINGENFVGVLEVPIYGARLPIGSSWDKSKVSQYPCRFWGSAYDGSLIIGGSDHQGQFDFIESISLGDEVSFTDMGGVRYPYTVIEIERTKDVSAEYLRTGEEKLVFFARNSYGFDYIVVRCE